MSTHRDDVVELLARCAGYLSRVEARTRVDRERLVFAQDQIMAALELLRAAEPPPSLTPVGADEEVG